MTSSAPRPTAWQVRRTREVVRWYLRHHHGSPDDPGTRSMYYDRDKVGHFAVRQDDLRAGRPSALFKVLVATAMFQRRQDLQIMRILRNIPAAAARELGSLGRLVRLAAESGCSHSATNHALLNACDLDKDPVTKEGICEANPAIGCHLKKHTVTLKRYGHFGKVPTSIALAIRETGARDLNAVRRRALDEALTPLDAAVRLEAALGAAWRVSQKIACMFLAALSNPDLGDDAAPWQNGVDWNHFVVIDSNVDLFLDAIGYAGVKTYDARREFLQRLARRVDLGAEAPALQPYNARLVQQAAYLFMSTTNRRALARDCSHQRASACPACPGAARTICPRRSQP